MLPELLQANKTLTLIDKTARAIEGQTLEIQNAKNVKQKILTTINALQDLIHSQLIMKK